MSSVSHSVCLPELVNYSLKAEVERASIIAVATPFDQSWIADEDDPGFYSGSVYKFNVKHTFKGEQSQEIELYDPNDSGRFAPELGEQYLIFFTQTENGYIVDNCGNSGKFENKQEVISELESLLSVSNE
jgi:hypothetical protein